MWCEKVPSLTDKQCKLDKAMYYQTPHQDLRCSRSAAIFISGTLSANANSVELDEVAHDEPPHLDLYCLPASL